MKKNTIHSFEKWGIFVFCVALLVLTGCQSDPAPDCEQIVRDFHRAFDQKNMALLTSHCSNDMFWYTLNGKALPRDEIKAYFTPMLERWGQIQTTLGELQSRSQGDLMTMRYKGAIQIVSNGRTSTMQTLYTTILVQNKGDWKIWQHHMSAQ